MKLKKILDKESIRIMTLDRNDLEKELSAAFAKIGWYDSQKNLLNLPPDFPVRKEELKELQPYIRVLLAISAMDYINKENPNYYSKLQNDIRKKKGNAEIDMKKIVENIPLLNVANNLLGMYV